MTTTSNPIEYLWTERYRPKTVAECILPDEIKAKFNDTLSSGEISNYLFTGGPGIGKTTVARALCHQLGNDVLFINGSKDRNIDTLNTTIAQYASTVSLSGKRKVVIIDEADYLNPLSMQPALRGAIEEYSRGCSFIFTANYKNKILPALQSRFSVVDFKIKNSDKPKLASAIFTRLKGILETESIEYDPKVLAALVKRFFPDFRRILGELQQYAKSGKIDAGILSQLEDVNLTALVAALKDRDFKRVRTWVVSNLDTDHTALFRLLYDGVYDYLEPSSIGQAILIIGDYSYKASFVADHEINMVCCLLELMVSVTWK